MGSTLLIGNVWIIDKRSGSCLIHRNYGKLTKIDSNLFSGLLTAIINFSVEITGGDFVRSVAMGVNKFFYHLSDDFIIAISMDENSNEEEAKPILQIILDSFISQGYAEKALNQKNYGVLEPFEKELDQMVHAMESSIIISQDNKGGIQERKTQTESPDPNAIFKKQDIEKAIENAEAALSGGSYKEAINFFKLAIKGFEDLKELEMANWCNEMINLTKVLWLKEIEEKTENIQSPQTKPVTEYAFIIPTIENEIPPPKDAFAPPEMIEQTPIEIKTVDTSSPKPEAKLVKKYKKIPVVIKNPGSKMKFQPPDSLVIILCNGENSIEDIVEKTKLSTLEVNEILRKYQKKKILEIKRVLM